MRQAVVLDDVCAPPSKRNGKARVVVNSVRIRVPEDKEARQQGSSTLPPSARRIRPALVTKANEFPPPQFKRADMVIDRPRAGGVTGASDRD